MKTSNRIARLALTVLWLAGPNVSFASPLDRWEARDGLLPFDDLQAVTWGNGLFVAVGSSAGNTLAFISSNGVSWRGRLADGPGTLTGVTSGGGMFVAVGNKVAGCSVGCGIVLMGYPSGEAWFERAVLPSNQLNAVTYGNQRFVAVGYDSGARSGVAITSLDGFTWTSHCLRESGITNSGILTGVTYGDGLFVAVEFSPGAAFTSADGVNWSNRGMVLGQPRSITYGDGLFAIAGGPTVFCCAANVSTSTDGGTWTMQYSGSAHYFTSISHGNGTFVAAGDWNGATVSSTDGAHWVQQSLGPGYSLNGVAYGNSTFVAVGGRTILQSASFAAGCLSEPRLTSEGTQLTLTGEIGRTYRLQGSTNLSASNWVDLLMFTNSGVTTNLLDALATNHSRRFYRAVSP